MTGTRTFPKDCPCEQRASGYRVEGYCDACAKRVYRVEGHCDTCAKRGEWAAPHPMTEPDVTVRELDGREADLCIAIADARAA